jgi:prevent-host-death family protein
MFSDNQPINAVSITTLSQRVSAVIEEVVSGKRVIVTKHGMPVAVIVSVGHGIDGLLAGSQAFALLRREAREELESGGATPLPPWRGSARVSDE